MGAVEKDDPELKAMLDEVEELFSQQEYTDEKTGLTVPYNLYLPWCRNCPTTMRPFPIRW